MSNDQSAMNELHWLIDMVQTIEVGLVVLDRDYNIQLWNGFMENHSGVSPNSIKGSNLFEKFPDLPATWLKHKMESVFLLKNRTFISWEQRPYVFQFKNYRPVTGRADFMYQNITLLPLASLTGQITHISIIVYDVTDIAVNKLQLKAANEQLEQLSQTDGLTLLHNRRHWQNCMEKEFDRYSRYGDAASLVMIDIDNFKRINDEYGHPAFTERLRKRIEASEVAFENRLIKVTVSLGINDLDSEIDNSSTWLSGADKALYVAKQEGRNKSIIHK